MATTPIRADANESDVPTKAFLTAEVGATGTPDVAGYTLTLGSNYGEYTFNVTEALVGIFRLTLENASSVTVAMGYVWIRADDTTLYIATASFSSALLQSICTPIMEDLTDGGRLDTILDSLTSNLSVGNGQTSASSIRAAVGLSSANLDVQLSTIDTQTDASTIRGAIGLASADLDTQISGISTQITTLDTEVNKVPRSASALSAGEFRQTNQHSEYLDITFSEPS
jgi:hypothetical protein